MTKADRRTFPRNYKSAKAKGWSVIYFPPNRSRTWLGLTSAIKMSSTGNTVNIYGGDGDGQIFFENATDAMFAAFKFSGVFQ